jgi:hypothetical protein
MSTSARENEEVDEINGSGDELSGELYRFRGDEWSTRQYISNLV